MAFHPAPNIKLPPPLQGYTLIERLGRGGFGEVWKCEAPGGFLKAVKFVYGDLESNDDVRAAEQEKKSLDRVKGIRHPYILSLERFDVIDGQLMIMMELAERNLWDKFRECRMLGLPGVPREELLLYMTEAAEALDLMNDEYHLQHLDIKPQNLFLTHNHIKVADFGLAKMFEGQQATVTGGVTPVYAAPETFECKVTRFSDQYSLAIVYQELLTGVRPFNGQTTKQLLLQHLRDNPELGSLPEHDRPIIGRALNKSPNARWPRCKDLVKALVAAPGRSATADFGALPLPTAMPKSDPSMPPGSRSGDGTDGQPINTIPATAMKTRVPGGGSGSVPMAPAMTLRAGAVAQAAAPAAFAPPVSPPPSRGHWNGGFNTPLPTLVTPKMAGPRAGRQEHQALGTTMQRAAVIETGRMGALGIAPPERSGDGTLFPALIVGLGSYGLSVIKRLKLLIRDRFGKADALPIFRFLYIDTDAEATMAATSGQDALAPYEVILTKLERPAHYLRRDGLPPVEQWMPTGSLYQLPKTTSSAAGRRAFGRLALCDNYRVIAQRIRREIEPFLSDDPLDRLGQSTGLGVRTNQPRAYVIAGLGGGTGSGMFLDVAYLLKHELRSVGYRKPEAFAVLFAPPAEKVVPRGVQANTFAALAELSHYSAGQSYSTKFDLSEAPLVDPNPPFERTAVLQLPKAQNPEEQAFAVGSAARAAFLDLLTPVGRKTDFARSAAPVDPYAGPTVQPFGVYRLSWPRYELLSAIVKRFSQQLLRRWTTKETTHLKEPIGWWLNEQWTKYSLDQVSIVTRVEQALRDTLREHPEKVFDAVIDTLRNRTPGNTKQDAHVAASVFDQLIKLVGKPDVDTSGNVVGSLVTIIDGTSRAMAKEAEEHLATVAVSFIEQPQYRLAGAEEALAQITQRLKATIDEVQEVRTIRSRECVETYVRVFDLLGELHAGGLQLVGRRSGVMAELCEQLAAYPRKRLRLLMLDAAISLFRRVCDGIPEYLQEVSACRARLDELADAISRQTAADPAAEQGAYVLPIGCTDLESTADQFIAALPADDLLGFDQTLQTEIIRKYRGLVSVCMKKERSERFSDLLVASVRTFLDGRLEKADPAEALTRYRGTGPECLSVLEKAFDKAEPNVKTTTKLAMEATFLAVPGGPSGEQLYDLMRQANPGVEFIPATLPDDILVYREFPRVPIGDLAQLGPTGEQAYAAAAAGDHPPHARVDVSWLAPIRPAPKG